MPAATIADLLAQLPEPAADQTAATYIAQRADTGHQAQVQANAYRIKLGLALLASKPAARKGVSEWEAASAERLGIEVRQLRTYCTTAKTVSATAASAAPARPAASVPAVAASAATTVRNSAPARATRWTVLTGPGSKPACPNPPT